MTYEVIVTFGDESQERRSSPLDALGILDEFQVTSVTGREDALKENKSSETTLKGGWGTDPVTGRECQIRIVRLNANIVP